MNPAGRGCITKVVANLGLPFAESMRALNEASSVRQEPILKLGRVPQLLSRLTGELVL